MQSCGNQADLFGFSAPLTLRRRRQTVTSVDEFRRLVDDALGRVIEGLDGAIEALRDALCTFGDDDETREAIEAAIEDLDVEIETVLTSAKIEIGL